MKRNKKNFCFFVFTILSVLLFSSNVYALENLDLKLYFPFDGNANDESGNGNNGIVSGAVLTTDRNGNTDSAYYFDGVNDRIRIPLSDSLILNSKTVTFWINVHKNKTFNMIYEDNNSKYAGFNTAGALYLSYLNLAGSANTFYVFNNAAPPVNGEWHFYAFVYDVNGSDVTVSVYRNGNLLNSLSKTDGLVASGITSLGSRNSVNNVLNGSLDDFRIYGRALTPSEINEVYTGVPLSVCGNSVIETSEGCDDGNIADGDGCSSSCVIESGWTCNGEPSVCTLVPCQLNSASWSSATAYLGENIILNVEGSNCADEVINYTIYKSIWWWFDKKMMTDSASGSTMWIAGYNSQTGVNETGTYYFRAIAEDGGTVEVQSGELIVNDAPLVFQCSDGIDNDNDGAIDYPDDFACSSPTDDDEGDVLAQCQDGIDNDGDSLIDYPQDSGCTSLQDDSEITILPSNCGNGNIDEGEQCDGANLNNASCTSLGFSGGTLSCYAPGTANECQYDTTVCEINIDNQKLNLPDCPSASNPRFNISGKTWPVNYGDADISLWNNDKVAAASITIDDGAAQDHPWWIEKGNLYNWRFTWYIIVSQVEAGMSYAGTWDGYRDMFNLGHDIGSHTMTHGHCADDCNSTNVYDCCDLDYEYGESQKVIRQRISSSAADTIAYDGSGRYVHNSTVAAKYYISGRGTIGYPNSANAICYMWTHSEHFSNDTIDMILDPQGAYYRGFETVIVHGLNYPPTRTNDSIAGNLDYLKSKEGDVWVDLYKNIVKYGEERDTGKLNVNFVNESEIRFILSDEMNDSYFNYPLTIKVRLNNEWEYLKATQDSNIISSRVIEHEGNKYALVKAIPDRGEVVLIKDVVQACSQDLDCDDGLFCNGIELCSNNICIAGTNPCQGYGCTTETCNENSNSCEVSYNDSICDDINSCTVNDRCVGEGGDLNGCVYDFAPSGISCSDGYSCTQSETCDGVGSCVGVPEDMLCPNLLGCSSVQCNPFMLGHDVDGCVYSGCLTSVLEYKMDDSLSDGFATDSSINSINGTCLGTLCPMYLAEGGHDASGAYLFPGAKNRINIPYSPEINLTTKTITFWANIRGNNSLGAVYSDPNSNYGGFDPSGKFITSYLDLNMRQSYVILSGIAKPIGEWGFYAVTYDVNGNNVNVSVYRDGNMMRSGVTTSGMLTVPVRVVGVRQSGGNSFNGTLDDFRVYNRVLSGNEIQTVFNS